MIPPERILLIRPSALGDVCRTVPLLAALKAIWPAARIDWLVQDAFADAVAFHPALNAVVPFQRKRFGAWYNPAALAELTRWLSGLRRARYGLVIDAQGLLRSGLFCRATGAPVRVGPADAREGGTLGYTRAVPLPSVDALPHTVDRMMTLVEALAPHASGSPASSPRLPRDLRLFAPPVEIERVARTFGSARYAVVAPTSRWPGKRWPGDRFAHLARQLLGRHAVEMVAVVGARGERDQCANLLTLAAADPRVIDLVGETTVGGLMALIARSSLVVANDSAALHMAVGFDRPTVALFGPTDVRRVGPYGREGCVLQRLLPGDTFDHKNDAAGAAMMARIPVEDALALVADVLRPSN